jgi:choline monooxygenase
MNRLYGVSIRNLAKWTPSLVSNTQKSFVRKLATANSGSAKELHRPLPPYLYNDASVYQLERENIFAKNWIYAGRLDKLQKLGDYLSITLAGYPIFIYRSPLTNELIAFHNVCSHRAGPIVPINSNNYGIAQYGNQSLLKCQYHAWLYDSRDGTLKATPNFNYKFKTEEKKCLNLKKIHFEIFAEQFIFVNLNDTKEKTSINTLLGDLLNDIMTFPLHEYRHFESQNHFMNCNWKTYIENYQEGYHVHSLHLELDKAIHSKQYTVTNKNNTYSVHYAPSRNGQSDQEKYIWTYIYPNLAVNLYERCYSIEHILPIGKDRTMICYEFFARSTDDESKMNDRIAEAKEGIIRTLNITNEDKMICEQVQNNLDAGIYKPGYLSPSMENGVQFFQERIRNELKHTKLQLE